MEDLSLAYYITVFVLLLRHDKRLHTSSISFFIYHISAITSCFIHSRRLKILKFCCFGSLKCLLVRCLSYILAMTWEYSTYLSLTISVGIDKVPPVVRTSCQDDINGTTPHFPDWHHHYFNSIFIIAPTFPFLSLC